ncbi:hypothetical protein SHJG_p1125 (plasmid) [Streptomyces hygroscopicus subsp. jinggangensis 5008]|nr:hypothetical protein SHJG_p1125 [Streptomyces hygroscopicus subsp. jinggangensis 5008]AGF68410.1 hypothetical protein SHJGH_p1125 [Streptomyces hygroscopicus subsp. jinggangensis TL01]
MTTTLYEIETSEADDGTTVPAECFWTPSSEDAADNGFVDYRGLYVAGIGAPNGDDAYPGAFILLGHHKWADIIKAAAAFMDPQSQPVPRRRPLGTDPPHPARSPHARRLLTPPASLCIVGQ